MKIPIVLVPGLLCSAEIFGPQIAALWPFGPVTVASTLEGATMVEIAASILANAPPKFALAGISMGGYICFEIMRQAPERVVKLALLDTSARPDTPEQTAQRRAMLEVAGRVDYAGFIERALAAILHPSHRENKILRATQVRMGLAVGLDGMARQVEAAIGRPDSRPDLPGIKVPTLVLVGDSDPLMPPTVAQEIASAIRGATLVIVPECGHASTIEQPEAVSQAMIDWIQK